jgi:hypothetical protein
MTEKTGKPNDENTGLRAWARRVVNASGEADAVTRQTGWPKMLNDDLPPGSCERYGTPPDLSDLFRAEEPQSNPDMRRYSKP